MKDALRNFDWPSLHDAYDDRCRGFNKESPHLAIFGSERPGSDRDLYYRLVHEFSNGVKTLGQRAIGYYEAVLYWKLYSQPAGRSNIKKWLPQARAPLLQLIEKLPTSLERKPDKVLDLIDLIREFRILGMKGRTSLPVQSTFCHFLFPRVVPIFDKMVLQAVGITDKRANKNRSVLREYLPFAWGLGSKYEKQIAAFPKESPMRVLDMALWVTRGNAPDSRLPPNASPRPCAGRIMKGRLGSTKS